MKLSTINKHLTFAEIKHREDFGHDFYLTIARYRNFCLFQGCFYTAVYGRIFPYLSVTLGSGRLLEISFSFYKIGFNLSFLTLWWFSK